VGRFGSALGRDKKGSNEKISPLTKIAGRKQIVLKGSRKDVLEGIEKRGNREQMNIF